MHLKTPINWRDILIGAIIGALVSPPITAGIQYLWDQWHASQRLLSQANNNRQLMTDEGLETARSDYQALIEKSTLTHRLRVEAYQGMSRTYSQWTLARVWRGLSPKQYPQLAEKYALLAQKEAPDDLATGLALTYSYRTQEILDPQQLRSKQKAKELLVKYPANPELKFLAGEPSFLDNATTDTISDFPILLSLSARFIRKAEMASDANERNNDIARATDFLTAADRLNPGNELVLFRRGYLAQKLQNDWNKAANYYEASLRKEPEFPEASNDLAAIYASWGRYDQAKERFQEAASTEDAPIESRSIALHNLGEVNLELGDKNGACAAWKQATELHNATDTERLLSAVHAAMCDYVNADISTAKTQYETAIELSRNRPSLNVADIKTYRDIWRVGPKELEVAGKLIELVSR